MCGLSGTKSPIPQTYDALLLSILFISAHKASIIGLMYIIRYLQTKVYLRKKKTKDNYYYY